MPVMESKTADVFAFGMIAVEVFTGKIPFGEKRNEMVALRILQGGRPEMPETAQAVGLTGEIWKLLQSCWQQNPKKRPTMEEIVRRWEKFAENSNDDSNFFSECVQIYLVIRTSFSAPFPTPYDRAREPQSPVGSTQDTSRLRAKSETPQPPTLSATARLRTRSAAPQLQTEPHRLRTISNEPNRPRTISAAPQLQTGVHRLRTISNKSIRLRTISAAHRFRTISNKSNRLRTRSETARPRTKSEVVSQVPRLEVVPQIPKPEVVPQVPKPEVVPQVPKPEVVAKVPKPKVAQQGVSSEAVQPGVQSPVLRPSESVLSEMYRSQVLMNTDAGAPGRSKKGFRRLCIIM